MVEETGVRVEGLSIKKDLIYKGQVVLKYTIETPQFLSAIFWQTLPKVNEFYRELARDFQDYCEHVLFRRAAEQYDDMTQNSFEFHPFEAMLVYTVTYNQNCVLSLFFDRYEYTGGAHGTTKRSSETWDLVRGRQCTLRDFLGMERYKAFILKEIDAQIARQNADGTGQYFDHPACRVADHFNKRSFYLTPEGVVIYFQQYDIAPYSSGIVEFLLPFDAENVVEPSCQDGRFVPLRPESENSEVQRQIIAGA